MPTDQHQAHRDRAYRQQQRISAAGRDIGSIPPIANPERRAACKDDLERFCREYNPDVFYLPLSRDHRRVIARIEEAVTMKFMLAFAMPRGSGKTSICRMATLWAVSYAWSSYTLVIGATGDKADDSLDAIKHWVRFLPAYVDDFPEVSHAAIALEGVANRASGQTCQGRSTGIVWSAKRFGLPAVPRPDNLDASMTAGDAFGELAPTSGSVIGAAGLTGEGLRGSLITGPGGEQVRPDFVLADDPQTDESAASPAQSAKRLKLVNSVIPAMAGPGRPMGVVMPCTVIEPGDMVDQVLDRKNHPHWRGERTRLLRQMPDDLTPWEPYFEVYDRCFDLEPPEFAAADAHYTEHRDTLDAGFEASWPDLTDDRVSAVQRAMNLYRRDPEGFFAEFQNEPLHPGGTGEDRLTVEAVLAQAGELPRRVAPDGTVAVTAFIDVQGNSLWWTLYAWREGMGGHLLDYGVYPEQKTRRPALSSITRTLRRVHKGLDPDAAMLAGLEALTAHIGGLEVRTPGGEQLALSIGLIDAGWERYRAVVYRVARASKGLWRPSYGMGITAQKAPMASWKHDRTDRRYGDPVSVMDRLNTKERCRYVQMDVNALKAELAGRYRLGRGAPGAIELFKPDRPDAHRTFAEHRVSEVARLDEANGRQVRVYKLAVKGMDNHWLDGEVGCRAGASIAGVRTAAESHSARAKPKRRRINVTF